MTLPADPPLMVRQGQSGGYFVRSEAHPGTWYFIWENECSCPATVQRCKHIRQRDRFVKLIDEQYKRPAAPVNRSLMVD